MGLVLTDAMESIPLCTSHQDTVILAELCPLPGSCCWREVLGGS